MKFHFELNSTSPVFTSWSTGKRECHFELAYLHLACFYQLEQGKWKFDFELASTLPVSINLHRTYADPISARVRTILYLGHLLLVREMRVLHKMWATKFRAKAGGANARVAQDKTHA